MNHLIIPPPPEFRHYIKYFWVFKVGKNGPRLRISTFVNDASGIVVITSGGAVRKAVIHGQTTYPSIALPASEFTVVGALFHPHAISEFLGVDAYHLTDRDINLDEFVGWNISNAILNTSETDSQIQLLINLLKHLQNDKVTPDPLVQHCMNDIRMKRGLITVGDLTRKHSISERQLQRRFSTTVGVSPRHFIKVTRFQEALTMLKCHGKIKLTKIAHSLHYADQAHFNRHVKQLCGSSPKILREKLRHVPCNRVGSTPYLVELL